MKGFQLTPEQTNELRSAHIRTKKRKQADRIKAVLLLGTGWPCAKVREVLLLDDDTLGRYVKGYREGGIHRLLQLRYKGRGTKLNEGELEALDTHLQATSYLTVEAIIAHVKKTYGVIYSVSGMTDLLHRLQFVYKKAKRVPSKADAQKQQQFLEELAKLKANKGKNDPILYMDGVHPQHNTMPAYGWVKKGKDNIVKTNTGRRRININGALDAQSHQVIVRDDPSINAQSTIELLKAVEETYPLAVVIYIICDNARYYRSKLVKGFLKGSKIQLVFLPSYSPNLNLIERLWRLMKKTLLYNTYYEKFDDFKEAVMGFFENLEQYHDELATLLTNNFRVLDSG